MEVAGLVFGALGALDVCFKACQDIKQYVRHYKNVDSDFEWASTRLAIFKTTFNDWVELWNIERNTPEETFNCFWGLAGTNAIKTHLKGIEHLCKKTNESQAKYKHAFEKKRSKFRVLTGKIRFTSSGRQELEDNLNNLRLEFDWIKSEAEVFFTRHNPTVSISGITKARICGIASESRVMDQAISVQQTSTQLFNGLEVGRLTLNLDLALQPDYVSKQQFKELPFDARKLHKESAKFPVVVNNISSIGNNFSPPSVFVLEAVEKANFQSPAQALQTKSFKTIVKSAVANQSTAMANGRGPNESFFLKCPSGPKFAMYQFLVHSTGFSPQPPEQNSISLQEFFDNFPQRSDQPTSRRTFAITWQFDLAYTLAVSVLNLQGSGWLNTLHSSNIYQRSSLFSSPSLSVKVRGGDSLAHKETPLDKLFRKASYLKPEIFRLGILMLEIGLARSVSTIFRDLEGGINEWTSDGLLRRLFCELDHSVCPIYTEITRACLEGDFASDDELSEASLMRSYISTVLEP